MNLEQAGQAIFLAIFAIEFLLWIPAMADKDKDRAKKKQKKLIAFHKKFFKGIWKILLKIFATKKKDETKKGQQRKSDQSKVSNYTKSDSSMKGGRTMIYQFGQEMVDKIDEVMNQVRDGLMTFKGAKKKLNCGSYQMWYLLACGNPETYAGMNADLYRLDRNEINEIETALNDVEAGEMTYDGALYKLDIEIEQLMIFVGMFSKDARFTSAETKPVNIPHGVPNVDPAYQQPPIQQPVPSFQPPIQVVQTPSGPQVVQVPPGNFSTPDDPPVF